MASYSLCIMYINMDTDYQPVIPRMADLWLHDYQIAVLQHQNLVTQLPLHQI